MRSFDILEPEELLAALVHDLRQPLSTIENSTFYLDLLLKHPHGPVHDQLHLIEQQVAVAGRMLAEAVSELRRLRDQRAAADSLILTNSATASVT